MDRKLNNTIENLKTLTRTDIMIDEDNINLVRNLIKTLNNDCLYWEETNKFIEDEVKKSFIEILKRDGKLK